jgi:polyhydroxybutyrate depolymerase
MCIVSAAGLAAGAAAYGVAGPASPLSHSQAACGRPKPRTLRVGDHHDVRTVRGRSYQLYVPRSYRPSRASALVLDFHYFQGLPAIEEEVNGFETVAAKAGFVLARPQASPTRGESWQLFSGNSDVVYVRAVLANIRSAVCIDPARIYAVGMSQGGALATLLTCRLPGTFAAVASVAMLDHPYGCQPSPTPIIAFTGRADTLYRIDVGVDPSTFQIIEPGAPADARPGPVASESAAWAVTNGCDPSPMVSHQGSGLEQWTYQCPSTSPTVVYVHSGGHVWPGPWLTLAEAATLGRFFEQHRKQV